MSASGLRALYICYLPLSDPLTETQVVAYLEGLARSGHTIHLLTFEAKRLSRAERQRIRGSLRVRGIAWHGLRYHKRPSLPATFADTLVGAASAAYLVRRHRLDVVHARVHVPAAMALLARMFAHHRLIFDVRGLMAEEYVDAGRWKKGGLPWRITKWVEHRALERAEQSVVLTPAARDLLFQEGDDRATVIPCCVDLSRFPVPSPGSEARRRLGLPTGPVLVYVGKFGGWYMQREMVEFFVEARRVLEGLHFLVLTQDDPNLIEAEFRRREVRPFEYTVTSVSPHEMGATLAAGDLAISFVEPKPSKVASSPTKIGEYLAAGLPVVMTAGVGALDGVINETRAGVLVTDLSSAGLRVAAQRAKALLSDAGVADRCRGLAEEELSLDAVGIPRYAKVYSAMAGAPVPRPPSPRLVSRRRP